jgi:hypothetical protein
VLSHHAVKVDAAQEEDRPADSGQCRQTEDGAQDACRGALDELEEECKVRGGPEPEEGGALYAE